MSTSPLDSENGFIGEQSAAPEQPTWEEVKGWLVAKIAATLEVPAATIEASQPFTAFGLESLDAFSIAGDLAEWLRRDLSATLLWEYPTIDALSSYLGREESAPMPRERAQISGGEAVQSPAWRALRPIQTEGNRPPFFCMHGAGGSMMWAGPLARLLGPEQPFYVFQHPIPQANEPFHWSMEGIAALYLSELRECQPKGPYYLGGLSLGGIIAFEMAQQLRSQGEEVALLALLDTALPRHARRLSPLKWLILHTRCLIRSQKGNRLAYLRSRGRANRQLGLRQVGAFAYRFYEQSGNVLPSLFRRIYIMNFAAAKAYRPKSYTGAVTLFRAMDNLDAPYDVDLGWPRIVPHGLEVRKVTGDHFTLTEEPHLPVLAVQLNECLQQAQHAQAAKATE